MNAKDEFSFFSSLSFNEFRYKRRNRQEILYIIEPKFFGLFLLIVDFYVWNALCSWTMYFRWKRKMETWKQEGTYPDIHEDLWKWPDPKVDPSKMVCSARNLDLQCCVYSHTLTHLPCETNNACEIRLCTKCYLAICIKRIFSCESTIKFEISTCYECSETRDHCIYIFPQQQSLQRCRMSAKLRWRWDQGLYSVWQYSWRLSSARRTMTRTPEELQGVFRLVVGSAIKIHSKV